MQCERRGQTLRHNMKQQTRKGIRQMTQYVSDTAAGKSISAWIILDRRGKYVAKVQAHFGNSRITVNVFDDMAGFQKGSASGYGYDKLTAALSGLTIAGHELTNHCARDAAPKKPKGLPCYPKEFKAPKGYALANYGSFSLKTGRQLTAYFWQDMARADLGDSAEWHDVAKLARDMGAAWESSADCVKGYSDCYRESGFKYLQAIGFQVIQAI